MTKDFSIPILAVNQRQYSKHDKKKIAQKNYIATIHSGSSNCIYTQQYRGRSRSCVVCVMMRQHFRPHDDMEIAIVVSNRLDPFRINKLHKTN